MSDYHPNSSPFPSNPANGFFGPILNNGPIPMLGEVPEQAALGNDNFDFLATPQNPRNMLMALRSYFPHLPILPIPSNVVSISLVANTPKDILVPDGAILGIFLGNGGYYVSANGNAEIPTVANETGARSMYAPEGFAFYLSGKRSFSCISPNTGTVVSLLTYSVSELPR